jgi:hypothetical protein
LKKLFVVVTGHYATSPETAEMRSNWCFSNLTRADSYKPGNEVITYSDKENHKPGVKKGDLLFLEDYYIYRSTT